MNAVDLQYCRLAPDIMELTPSGSVMIELETSLDACETIWRKFETDSSHYVFQKFEWHKAYMDTIGAELKVTPVIVLLRESNGQLLMLWPLALRRRGPLRFLVPLGGIVTDYHSPMISTGAQNVVTPTVVEKILTKIRTEIAHYDVIVFDKMPDLIDDQANPLISLPGVEPQGRNAHATRLGNDFETWVKTQRSSNVLKDERRSLRRLAEIAAITPRINVDGVEGAAIGEALIGQKSRRWRQSGQPDLFRMQSYRDFYIQMIEKRACQNESHVSALQLGDEFIACHLGLFYRKRFYYLMPTFSTGYHDKYSPGNLLLLKLLRWCVSNKISCFDFTVGDESYKTAWCDVTLPLYRYLRTCSLLGRCYVLASRLIDRARRVEAFRRFARSFRKRSWAWFAGR